MQCFCNFTTLKKPKKPAVLSGVGRPMNSKDKAQDSTRSERFHMETRNQIAAVAREFARTRDCYTYREIGKFALKTRFLNKIINICLGLACSPTKKPDCVRKSLKKSGFKYYKATYVHALGLCIISKKILFFKYHFR